MKSVLIEIFIDEQYSSPPRKNYPTNKIVNIYIDELWSIDLADKNVYKRPNVKGFKYILVKIDIFSKYVLVIPLKRNS